MTKNPWRAKRIELKTALWLMRIFQPKEFRALVKGCAKKLKQIHQKTPFDTIVGTGISGAVVSALSYELGIPMVLVRKDTDIKSHSRQMTEGHRDVNRYVIIDDLIDSGKTVDYIFSTMKKEQVNHSKYYNRKMPEPVCVGIVLYDEEWGGQYYTLYDKRRKKEYQVPVWFVK